MIVQHLAVQRSQRVSFLCCYVVCEMEKTICPLPRLKFILNSIKNVHAPMKPQRGTSAAWDYGSTLLRTIFELLFQEFCYEAYSKEVGGLFKRGGRVPRSFFFQKPNETMSFLRSACQSTLLKHAGEVLFVLSNADFFNFRNASELSWGKVLLIRVLYREQIMRHGWSVTLT